MKFTQKYVIFENDPYARNIRHTMLSMAYPAKFIFITPLSTLAQ